MDINTEEEQGYIMMLNRNIKNENKIPKKTSDFVDVDAYFSHAVNSKIAEKEQSQKFHPIDFQKIVKNYAYFLEEEEFGTKEFGFAKKMLHAKDKEALGESSITTKYIPPLPRMAERNNVKVEAKNMESKFVAENKLKQRNDTYKNYARTILKKDMRITSAKEDNRKAAASIEELDGTKTVKLSNILMKHSDLLGLKGIQSTIKDHAIKDRKKKERLETQEQMKKLGLGQIEERVRTSPRTGSNTDSRREALNVDPSKMKKYAQTTKDMIQLMMENIEKNIEEDDGLQRKIKDNKPLVVEKKKKEKFLKVTDELSKSTQLIQIRRDANKKIFDFSELVKINSQLAGIGTKGKLQGLLKKKNSITKDSSMRSDQP